LVALFEKGALFRRETHAEGADVIVEVRQLRRADDRRGDAGLREQPRQRNLGRFHAPARRELDAAVGDGKIRIAVIELTRVVIALRTRGIALSAVAGENARGEGTPWMPANCLPPSR